MTQEQLDYLSSVKDVATKYALLSGDNSQVSYILEHGTNEQKHWIAYNIPGGAKIDNTVAAYVEQIRKPHIPVKLTFTANADTDVLVWFS